MTKTRINNYEKEKFNNFVHAMSECITSITLELYDPDGVDLFPTQENILNRARERFIRLKKCGFYDDLNRINIKVLERIVL